MACLPQNHRIGSAVALAMCALRFGAIDTAAGEEPRYPWTGQGAYRVLVEIKPPGRTAARVDERPADVVLNFDQLLAQVAPGRRPNFNSVQVIRHDRRSGIPLKQGAFAYGTGQFDIAWRWYDAAIPYAFPEVEANVSSTDGELRYVNRPRFGYFYDCIGNWRQGHFAFLHRDQDEQPGRYAIYFDLLPEGAEPTQTEPRGFLGDGLCRCAPVGDSSTGLIHSRIDVADWRGDGRLHLLVGSSRGGLVVYPDSGKPGSPEFSHSRLVFTSDGRPLDVGWSAAPHVVDWDGDGLPDLLAGAEWNRVLLFRNRGTREVPSLVYDGPLKTADGQVLALPTRPVPEGKDVFQLDYYPVLETADWDGDGDIDLMAGGYITGRVYWYENLASRGREPKLELRGPIEADGQPLDVQWGAAPSIRDLDADGDLDLITGCMPITAHGGDAASSEHFLHYFRNDGDARGPLLHEVPFPREGEFPLANLGTPRLVDWSGDGLLDLIVSANTQIYLYRNVGTPNEPRFAVHRRALPGRWGSATLAGVQFLDWNADGLVDAANGPRIYLNTGQGSPGIFGSPVSLLKPGQTIGHSSGIGDDWQYQRLYDLDQDGRIDLLDADHGGHVWWHKNVGAADQPNLASDGVRLQLVSGEPLVVGLNRKGFDALQGARATYTAADFNRDARVDLVVTDTFGIVRYFEQADVRTTDGAPRFDAPIELGRLPIRGVPEAADWNGDGWIDVIAGSDAEHLLLFVNRAEATGARFAPGKPIRLSAAPYGAGGPVAVADYNGDGDADIVLQTAYGYTCYYERSFIEHGYAEGRAIGAEKRPR